MPEMQWIPITEILPPSWRNVRLKKSDGTETNGLWSMLHKCFRRETSSEDSREQLEEVPAGGICDIVVDKGIVKVGIEVKTSLNFEVIQQAFDRREYFHYVYIAVPVKHKVSRIQERICREFGIGILGYKESDYNHWRKEHREEMGLPDFYIEEHLKPKLNRKPRKIKLEEYMMRSIAGSQNSRITAFGDFVDKMVKVVEKEGKGIGVKELFDKIEVKHYRTLSVFRSSVVKYVNTGVIKGIDFRDGKFFISKGLSS